MQFDVIVPNVVDRVVQQAMLQVLETVFEPTFHPSSHGFRPKRGAPTAIAEAKEHLEAGYQTIVILISLSSLIGFIISASSTASVDVWRIAG